MSMFIVEKGTPGFTVGRQLDKGGWLSSDTAELVFDDCRIPAANLLGEENRGFYSVMKNFQTERIALGAMAVGHCMQALQLTLEHVRDRRAFGATLFDKQVVRQRLAMLDAKVRAARAFMYHCAWRVTQGHDVVQEVSMLKALTGELVNEVVQGCQQFHGGMGYMRGTPIERLWRDARILAIGGGATEVMLMKLPSGTSFRAISPGSPATTCGRRASSSRTSTPERRRLPPGCRALLPQRARHLQPPAGRRAPALVRALRRRRLVGDRLAESGGRPRSRCASGSSTRRARWGE